MFLTRHEWAAAIVGDHAALWPYTDWLEDAGDGELAAMLRAFLPLGKLPAVQRVDGRRLSCHWLTCLSPLMVQRKHYMLEWAVFDQLPGKRERRRHPCREITSSHLKVLATYRPKLDFKIGDCFLLAVEEGARAQRAVSGKSLQPQQRRLPLSNDYVFRQITEVP